MSTSGTRPPAPSSAVTRPRWVPSLEPRLSGSGVTRIRPARLTALWSYFAGAGVYLAIGVLNPHGLVIVITSALASSMGGTSGLLWMTRLLKREPSAQGLGIYFGPTP